ncbi:MAG TPA: hypothetical protein VF505_15385, partial [Thermoanaerobaculia bacterium]
AEMSTDVVMDDLTIRGRVGGDGFASTTAGVTLTNHGALPIAHLGFALNPGMRINAATADDGSARVERIWERVGVTLDPPLAAHAMRRLRFALSGTPGTYEFALNGGYGFLQRYRRYVRARDAGELSDLSRSHLTRAASNVRVELVAADLAPVPRYSPWTVGVDAVGGAAFTQDPISSTPRVKVQLEMPRGLVAADACSAIGSGSIETDCVMAINDYVIVAAPWTVSDLGSGISFASLPAHMDVARAHAQTMGGAVRLARDAWPDVRLPRRITFVEEPTANGEEENGYRPRESLTAGALNLIPELTILRKQPVDTRLIAATLITNSLLGRRAVDIHQRGFFAMFLGRVALARLGKQLRSAVVPPVPGTPVTEPILEGNEWNNRLQFVLSDLENRVGSDRLMQGIADFLSARGGAGTAKELLQAIGRRGGVSLDRMYDDYFAGHAIPRLTLETVTFTRSGNVWSVRGAVRNNGTGEAFCPVVLRTSAGALRQTIRIDSGETVPFAFTSQYDPRTVQLDPDKVCYRFAYIGSIDSVDYRGQS